MLDLVLSLFIAMVLGFFLLRTRLPKWATVVLVFVIAAIFAYAAPMVLGLNNTGYSDLLSVGQLNLLIQQSNGDIFTAIRLSTQFGPYMIYIVIGLNLIAAAIGLVSGYGLFRLSKLSMARHNRRRKR